MTSERNIFYTISVLVGFFYLLTYALFMNYLGHTPLGWIIPLGFLILDGGLIIGLIIKDVLDERAIHRGGSPVGPSWFEHTPFAFMLAIHLIVLLSDETDILRITIELILLGLILFDLVLDMSQDLRSKHNR
ncbi:MAG: hypothetical protein ACTSQI_13200 [Candidatus Helarchaeota archaeon]